MESSPSGENGLTDIQWHRCDLFVGLLTDSLLCGKVSAFACTFLTCEYRPVMNGHPRDQAKVSVHCRWPLIRGNLTLKCVGRGIDNVAVQGRWPLTTGVAQGRYYCNINGPFVVQSHLTM